MGDVQVVDCVEPLQRLMSKMYAVRVKYKYPGKRAGSLIFTFSRKADAEEKFKKMVALDEPGLTATELLVSPLNWEVVDGQ